MPLTKKCHIIILNNKTLMIIHDDSKNTYYSQYCVEH